VGASIQANLKAIAASAPIQTIPSTTGRQLPFSTSRPKAV
jgi:hypothetical protein